MQKLQDNNFTISIIRTPIVYGKGVKANILSLVKLVDKVPILPFGNIPNKRSMVYIGNLCEMVDTLCTKKMDGIFLAGDDEAVSTTRLIEIIARAKGKKIKLFKFSLLPLLLRMVKPSYYKRLYKSLEIDNRITKKRLGFDNSVSMEDGIKYMLTL
ncbi:MAG: epimerase, partial [Spirochaetota bacterium]|nr:epimerase [Spirochaetota bacterium]